MKTDLREALILSVIMGLVIFFCRVCPFWFFRETTGKTAGSKSVFLDFVEKIVPPLAMTVLTLNSLTALIYENLSNGIPVLCASGFTVIMHLWLRNPLISIFGGTAVFMILQRLMGG